jgi:hypothetical protein
MQRLNLRSPRHESSVDQRGRPSKYGLMRCILETWSWYSSDGNVSAVQEDYTDSSFLDSSHGGVRPDLHDPYYKR